MKQYMSLMIYSICHNLQDFATRSLKISEETPLEMHERRMEDETLTSDESVLDLYKMRRTWETRYYDR